MDLYNHLIFVSVAIALTLAFTSWYKFGRNLLLPLLSVDLIIHIFVHFDLIRIVFAALVLVALIREIITRNTPKMTRKLKLLGGFVFTGLGILMTLAGLPYFLLAGLVIIIVTLKGNF